MTVNRPMVNQSFGYGYGLAHITEPNRLYTLLIQPDFNLISQTREPLATKRQPTRINNRTQADGNLLDSVKQYGKFDESQGVGQHINQADEYQRQYEKSSGVADTETPTPLDEAPLSEKSESSLEEKKAEVPLPVEGEEKADVPLPVEGEEKAEAPLPVEGEEKTEAPLPVEEEKEKVPLPVEEKGGKDKFETAVGVGDALKAAGSYFK
ncbi:uncharacterized protein LOC143586002 [Bidens hawaiensis]|uniref:uncharacterized protein LOC143586002 n=1 Tax=Bidens hawaiensis TaxID=980011 RepID=UPI00404945BD